jgi:hypothetical protein
MKGSANAAIAAPAIAFLGERWEWFSRPRSKFRQRAEKNEGALRTFTSAFGSFVRACSKRDGEGRNRTGDTTVFSRVLYQLSYLAALAKSIRDLTRVVPRRKLGGDG